MDSHHLRALILKIQNYLSDDDRQRLHFFLGPDIPRRIRDDPTLSGTLDLIESLFEQDKINERDFTFLINAFDVIQCFDAVNILREHMKRMQASGQNQSILSLPSILYPEEEEDKYARETYKLIGINNNKGSIDPVTVAIDKQTSTMNSLKSLIKTTKFLLLFGLLLIIGLVIVTSIYIMKNRKLKEELETKDTIISVEQTKNNNYNKTNQRLINELTFYKQMSRQNICSTPVPKNTKWKQDGITVAGGNGKGDRLNQFDWPQSIYVDDDHRCIYIADYNNHRIIQWKFNARIGQVVAGGNDAGHQMNQLFCPTDVIVDKKTDTLIICDNLNRRVVRWARENSTNGRTIISDIGCYGLAMDNNGDLYISNWHENEVRRWKEGETEGTVVAGGNGEGDQLNQFYFPNFFFIDANYSVYVSDQRNYRVMKWMKDAKEGIVVAGGQGQGNMSTQLSDPQGVYADHLGDIYVADTRNHRIMCWSPGSTEGRIVVGGNGKGEQSNQLFYPRDLSFDQDNNLYVVDSWNRRIQRFDVNRS